MQASIRVDKRLRNFFRRSKFSPVTFDTWKIGQRRSLVKLVAQVMTSSLFCTRRGIFRTPGDRRMRWRSLIVSWRTLPGAISILVTTTNTGTPSAKANPYRKDQLAQCTRERYGSSLALLVYLPNVLWSYRSHQHWLQPTYEQSSCKKLLIGDFISHH